VFGSIICVYRYTKFRRSWSSNAVAEIRSIAARSLIEHVFMNKRHGGPKCFGSRCIVRVQYARVTFYKDIFIVGGYVRVSDEMSKSERKITTLLTRLMVVDPNCSRREKIKSDTSANYAARALEVKYLPNRVLSRL